MNRLLCRVRPVSLLLGIGLVLCLSVSHPLAAQDIPCLLYTSRCV